MSATGVREASMFLSVRVLAKIFKGAGLTGGLLILIAAGLQAFLFWTLGDILALLLMLRVAHPPRIASGTRNG